MLKIHMRRNSDCALRGRMKPDEPAHPVDITILRPYAVVQVTDALAKLVEQFGRLERGKNKGSAFHGLYNTG